MTYIQIKLPEELITKDGYDEIKAQEICEQIIAKIVKNAIGGKQDDFYDTHKICLYLILRFPKEKHTILRNTYHEYFLKYETKKNQFKRSWKNREKIKEEDLKKHKAELPALFYPKDATRLYELLEPLYGDIINQKILKDNLQDIVKKILEEPAEEIEESVEEVIDELKLARNQDWNKYVVHRCGNLNILGIQPKKVEEFYVPLTIVRSDGSEPQFLIPRSDDSESLKSELFQEFQDQKKILIYGEAGIGKTTLLKHLALECLKKNFKKDYIPMYISVRRLRSVRCPEPLENLLQTYREIIEPESKVCSQEIEDALGKGKILLLVDGLDLNENNISHEINCFKGFIQKYPDNSFIIASKTKNIIESEFKEFQKFKLDGLNMENTIEFVKKLNSGSDKTSLFSDLNKQKDKVPKTSLIELATSTPLILSCLYSVYPQYCEEQLACVENNDALRLYQLSMAKLLQWEDKDEERSNKESDLYHYHLTDAQRANLIGYIAYELMKRGEFGDYVKKMEIQELIVDYAKKSDTPTGLSKELSIDKAGDILNTIESQDGIIVEKINGDYDFFHQEIKQYFAALHLSKASFSEWEYRLKNLPKNQSLKPFFVNAFRLRELASEEIRNKIPFPKPIVEEVWKVEPQNSEKPGLTIYEKKDNALNSIDNSQIAPNLQSKDINEWLNGNNLNEYFTFTVTKNITDPNTQS